MDDMSKGATPGAPSFGFVIHPPTIRYVRRAMPQTRFLPDVLVTALLKRQRPFLVSRIRRVRSVLGNEVQGFFVGCPLLPRQMLDLDLEFVLGRVVGAGRIAERLGVGILGLGGYTSIIGDRGCRVAERLSIAVTSGSSLTAWSAVEAVRRLCARNGVDLAQRRLSVVGATGSIGSLCTRHLAGSVAGVIITARHRDRLERLKEELGRAGHADVTVELDAHRAVAQADAVITTTSAPDALFGVEELRPGAVVVDVSVPKNISTVDNPRKDVTVVEGGRIRLPFAPEFSVDIGLPDSTVYACMAETMALALEGRCESYSLGDRIELGRVDEIGAIARKHGFDVWLP